jgi:hypothetical protein
MLETLTAAVPVLPRNFRGAYQRHLEEYGDERSCLRGIEWVRSRVFVEGSTQRKT